MLLRNFLSLFLNLDLFFISLFFPSSPSHMETCRHVLWTLLLLCLLDPLSFFALLSFSLSDSSLYFSITEFPVLPMDISLSFSFLRIFSLSLSLTPGSLSPHYLFLSLSISLSLSQTRSQTLLPLSLSRNLCSISFSVSWILFSSLFFLRLFSLSFSVSEFLSLSLSDVWMFRIFFLSLSLV